MSEEEVQQVENVVDGPIQQPEWPTYCNPQYIMPDVIESKVMNQMNGRMEVSSFITVSRETDEKLYIGGFKNKKTGHLYHHAFSQTAQEKQKWNKTNDHLRHRDTQTNQIKSRSINTIREHGTQMTRCDLYMDDSHDREISARPYFTAAALLQRKRGFTILIQRYWRGYLARQRTKFIREQIKVTELEAIEKVKQIEVEKDDKYHKEIERRMNPQTTKDFETLYNELEAWRIRETNKINNADISEESKGDARNELLAKEIKLLQTIDRLKITAHKDGRDEKIKHMLKLMAMPKRWQLSDGETAEVHTPFTIRAKELMDLYVAVSRQAPSTDERLNILLNLKWTVTEFDCPITREIVDLIDREADLLNRGRSEKSLIGLRTRLNNLFLQFIQTPDFNLEAKRFLKVQYSKVKPLYPAVIGQGEAAGY